MSLSIWKPLGRLTYCTYLTHLTVVMYMLCMNVNAFSFSSITHTVIISWLLKYLSTLTEFIDWYHAKYLLLNSSLFFILYNLTSVLCTENSFQFFVFTLPCCIISWFFAYWLSVLFELPTSKLEMILLGKIIDKSTQKQMPREIQIAQQNYPIINCWKKLGELWKMKDEALVFVNRLLLYYSKW